MPSCWRSWRRPWGRHASNVASGARRRALTLLRCRRCRTLRVSRLSSRARASIASTRRSMRCASSRPQLCVCSSTRPAPACQVLRKQCLAFPSRADTQAAIAGVEQDVAALEQESAATAATVEVRAVCEACDCVALSARGLRHTQLRRQQFRDLIESVDKLARALEEDGPVQPLPSAAAPMQVDSA